MDRSEDLPATLGAALGPLTARLKGGAPSPQRGLCRLAPRPTRRPSAQPAVARTTSSVRSDLFALLQKLVTGLAPWPLYLHGPAGTGKTCAALALLDLCGPAVKDPPLKGSSPMLEDWFSGYADARHLPRLKIGCDRGRFQWTRGALSGDASWETLQSAAAKAPLFVLDEIGLAREAGDFSREVLLEVLGWRCNDPVKPLVVTSNRPPDELASAYDERVASRLLCGSVFCLDGPDRRFPLE